MSRLLLIFMLMTLAACRPLVPATRPPQLNFTPGAPLRFDENRVVLDTFSLLIPPDWKVVKNSTAEEALRVVLVSPSEEVLITVGLAPLDMSTTDTQGRAVLLTKTLPHADTTLYLAGQALPSAYAALEQAWDALIASIQKMP